MGHYLLTSAGFSRNWGGPLSRKSLEVSSRSPPHAMEIGTLVMSAGLNALAFTGGAFDAAHWAQIAFGCFVPAAISGATFILARLTRR
jgi:hypothetical protein